MKTERFEGPVSALDIPNIEIGDLEMDYLVEIEVMPFDARPSSGAPEKFVGRITNANYFGYALREGDFFKSEGAERRALSLVHNGKMWRLSVLPGEKYQVKRVDVVGLAGKVN